MQLNRKIIIILSLVVLAILSLLIVAAGSDSLDEPEDLSFTPSERYFVDMIQQQTLNRLDGHPIEGLEQLMYMDVYPGLVAEDFEGAQTRGDLNEAGVQTSADATVTDAGLVQLLHNTAERLEVNVTTNQDVDALLVLLSQDPAVPVTPEAPATTDSNPDDVGVANSCSAAGGTWLAESKECEYISRQWCSQQDGNFQECTSACRHQENAEICTSQCVPVCQL
ncbi:MAG: trypsin inhibitor-like cysteine-rich domain-containing protein [Candidatus Paceibacterota bacterium]